MANYRLSTQAQNDITEIYKYGIAYFGQEQATKYLHDLEHLMLELSTRPKLSRDASNIAASLKYYSFKAHVIFYIRDNVDEIHIVRVLGKRMNFIQHL